MEGHTGFKGLPQNHRFLKALNVSLEGLKILKCLMVTRCKFILRLVGSISHTIQRWSQSGGCWWTDVRLVPGHLQPPWRRSQHKSRNPKSCLNMKTASIAHFNFRAKWHQQDNSGEASVNPIDSQLYTHTQDTTRVIIQGVNMLWIWNFKKVIQK